METTPNSPEFVPPPLPPPPPPLITPPPAAPQPRRGRGWMVAAIIVTIFLVLSLFVNLAQLVADTFSFKHNLHTEAFGSARNVGPRLEAREL